MFTILHSFPIKQVMAQLHGACSCLYCDWHTRGRKLSIMHTNGRAGQILAHPMFNELVYNRHNKLAVYNYMISHTSSNSILRTCNCLPNLYFLNFQSNMNDTHIFSESILRLYQLSLFMH